jgi:hypothetical protein
VDRNDARFAADVLERRLSGDREAIALLAATEAVRIMAAAVVLKRAAADCLEAQHAALELEAVIRLGGAVCDVECDAGIKKIVDSLRRLADEEPSEPAPCNRFERRRASKVHLTRSQRLRGIRPRDMAIV